MEGLLGEELTCLDSSLGWLCGFKVRLTCRVARLHVDFNVGVQNGHHVPNGSLPPGQSGLGKAQLLHMPDFPPQNRTLLVDGADVLVQLFAQVFCTKKKGLKPLMYIDNHFWPTIAAVVVHQYDLFQQPGCRLVDEAANRPFDDRQSFIQVDQDDADIDQLFWVLLLCTPPTEQELSPLLPSKSTKLLLSKL